MNIAKNKKDCHKNEPFNRAYTQNPFYISYSFLFSKNKIIIFYFKKFNKGWTCC